MYDTPAVQAGVFLRDKPGTTVPEIFYLQSEYSMVK